MRTLKRLAAVAAAGVVMALSPVTAYAGITYSMSASPSRNKTITWRMDSGGSAEFRYKAGADDESGFDSAYSLGSASNASVEVSNNGEYTMYARTEDGDIMYEVIPVTNIDDASPVITLLDIIKNADGTYDVTYSATDAFDVADTRMIGGSVGTDYFDAASSIGGGVLKNLTPGEYTIFAKDTAGNIASYPFSLDATEWSTEYAESTSSEWSTEWSTEYYGAGIELHYKNVETGTAQLSKQDATTGSELPGAKMTLKDTEIGEVIEEWTSGTSPHIIKGLTPGRTYTLIEVAAPDGYSKAESIEFTVKSDGTVTKVTMFDAPKPRHSGGGSGSGGSSGGGPGYVGETVELCKKDVATGNELPGAHMELWNKDKQTIIDSWTSGTTPHYVSGLSKGVTYTLVEITAPDGYSKAESIDFTIRDTSTVTRVTMFDAPINTPAPAPVPTSSGALPKKTKILPQTGGYWNLTSLFLLVGVICLGVGIYSALWYKKKSQ